jgi:hypothetical protein
VSLLKLRVKAIALKRRRVCTCLKARLLRRRYVKFTQAARFIKAWLRLRARLAKKKQPVLQLPELPVSAKRSASPPPQPEVTESISSNLSKLQRSEELTHELFMQRDCQLTALKVELRLSRLENQELKEQHEAEKDQLLTEIQSQPMRSSEVVRGGNAQKLKRKLREVEAQNSAISIKLESAESTSC